MTDRDLDAVGIKSISYIDTTAAVFIAYHVAMSRMFGWPYVVLVARVPMLTDRLARLAAAAVLLAFSLSEEVSVLRDSSWTLRICSVSI